MVEEHFIKMKRGANAGQWRYGSHSQLRERSVSFQRGGKNYDIVGLATCLVYPEEGDLWQVAEYYFGKIKYRWLYRFVGGNFEHYATDYFEVLSDHSVHDYRFDEQKRVKIEVV